MMDLLSPLSGNACTIIFILAKHFFPSRLAKSLNIDEIFQHRKVLAILRLGCDTSVLISKNDNPFLEIQLHSFKVYESQSKLFSKNRCH